MMLYLLHFAFLLLLSPQAAPPLASQQDDVLFSQPFTLRQFNQVTLSDSTRQEESKLVLRLGNILDSRCPQDVLCIQAGQADLNLSLSATGGEAADLNISYAGNRYVKAATPEILITLSGKTYGITVLDVAPYPVAKGVPLPKSARLVIAKL